MSDYPLWRYFPPRDRPPDWVDAFLGIVGSARVSIDSTTVPDLTSDKVLAFLRPGLVGLGYEVDAGKKALQKIRRPVLFGDQGLERVAYEVDAVHDDLGILVEVEAGRRGNAIYRDLIRASLIVGARYLVLGVMCEYRHQQSGKTVAVQSFRDARDQLAPSTRVVA